MLGLLNTIPAPLCLGLRHSVSPSRTTPHRHSRRNRHCTKNKGLVDLAKVHEDHYYRRFQRRIVGAGGMRFLVDQQYSRFISRATAKRFPRKFSAMVVVKFRQAARTPPPVRSTLVPEYRAAQFFAHWQRKGQTVRSLAIRYMSAPTHSRWGSSLMSCIGFKRGTTLVISTGLGDAHKNPGEVPRGFSFKRKGPLFSAWFAQCLADSARTFRTLTDIQRIRGSSPQASAFSLHATKNSRDLLPIRTN